MKPTRHLGNLSSLHLPGIAAGLEETTADRTLSPEETKRLKRFLAAVKPLAAEAKAAMQADVVERSVRATDLRVDRDWIVVRDIVEAYGRLEGVVPIGDEAARLQRKYLTTMAFLRYDTSAQAAHGKTLLACIAEEPMSKELAAALRPALAVLKADHAEYEATVRENLVFIDRISALGDLRREALDALQSFVVLAEAMATTPEEVTALNAVLAPVDSSLARLKSSTSKGAKQEPITEPITEPAPTSQPQA